MRRRWFGLLPSLLLILCAGRSAAAQAAGTRLQDRNSRDRRIADSTSAADVVTGYHLALQRGDARVILELLLPDAVILEDGRIETVRQYASQRLAEQMETARSVSGSRGMVSVTVRGDFAWAVTSGTMSGTVRGRAINSSYAESVVLSRTARGWRISALHRSSAPRPPAGR